MKFRAVEARIRKSTFVESIPLLATSFVLFFFVCLLVSTVAADKVAESMSMGLMYSAFISIIPFALALKYCFRHVVEGRRHHYEALRLFGLTLKRIRRVLFLELLTVYFFFSIVSAILVPVLMKPIFLVLYSGFGIDLPQGLPSPLLVAVISWCAIVCLSFVPFQQETRVLEDLSQGPTRIDPTPRNPRAAELLRYPLGIAACVVLLVGFVAMPQAEPSSRWPFIFVYCVPFLVSAASVFVYAVVLYIAEYLSLKFRGWNPPILGVRYARSFIATTILRVSCIFILFPIILFIANDSALYSAREELADNVKNVYVGSPQDGQTISTSAAQNICQDHAADCLGVLSWVPAVQDSEELQPSTMEEGAVFALVEDRDGTVSSLVNDREVVETEPRSPFDQTWMRPWDKTFSSEADPSWRAGERKDEGYAVAIFSKQVELSDSQAIEVIGAQQWAENLPSTLLYGPNGTGTSEFIPLFAYVIVGGAVLIFGLALAQQGRLIRFTKTIWEQGVSVAEAHRNRKLANCLPSAFALALSLGTAALLGTYMHSYIAHKLVLHFPAVPFGLILFLVVVVGLAAVGSNFVKGPRPAKN
ncbi:ABC transporter permease [Corynebacterium kefirresidentii]|uniref:FtsX-like permease family protein n=1 Tax=Corynebacterium sp. MSK185 TaxID=3377092 RepID=UPI00254EEF05|nr:FtsX-like permease family protein [Corynebacterium kefirresidentii]MDK8586563.1 ABC transporter permease [Corynebacterium kefirresidentii]